MPNELLCIVGFRIWEHRISFVFSFITNSTSRMHAHTGIKHFHKIHHPPKKWGGSGLHTCWRPGLEQSQFFAVLLHVLFWWLIFRFLEICLSTRFLFLINTIVQHFWLLFAFASPEDRIHLKAKYSYTNNKAPYETLSLPREKGGILPFGCILNINEIS